MSSKRESPVYVIRAESRRAQDRPAVGRAWHEAMQRWQRMADRASAHNGHSGAIAAAQEEVELTDLDPLLCAARGWR